jgi:hypothetical protein
MCLSTECNRRETVAGLQQRSAVSTSLCLMATTDSGRAFQAVFLARCACIQLQLALPECMVLTLPVCALCLIYILYAVMLGFKPVLSAEGLRRATSYGGNVFVANTQQQHQHHRHSVAATPDVHSASVGTQRSTKAQNSSGDESTAPSFRDLARPQASHLLTSSNTCTSLADDGFSTVTHQVLCRRAQCCCCCCI